MPLRAEPLERGVCRGALCALAEAGTPVDRYAGPGEYCPECGELLEVVAPPAPAPFGGLSALEALQQFDAAPAPPVNAPPRKRRPPYTKIALVGGGIGAAALGAVFVVHPPAIGHATPPVAVRICRSTMTERFAADVVRAFAAQRRVSPAKFGVSSGDGCDVRIDATADAGAAAIGYDGVVVIVNPKNRISHLSNIDVRRIFRGEVSDWSQLGGVPGPIEAYLPEDGTDEARLLAQRFSLGTSIADAVRRLPSGAEIAHAVTGPGAPGAIGMVGFSASLAAKVVRLEDEPVPSVVSIADQRYPLSVGITVQSIGEGRPLADALVRFARSPAAQPIVAQAGFISKRGY